MNHRLWIVAAAVAILSSAPPAAATSGQRLREGPRQATVPAPARKFAKPRDGALDLSVLEARIRLRREVTRQSQAVEILPAGATFRLSDGALHERPFALVGYCEKPRKVGSRQATRWVFPAFQSFAWQTKDEAESFCRGWNRLVYAFLTQEGVDNIAPPSNVLRLTPGMARAAMRELIPKRHLVSFEISEWTLSIKLSNLNPEKQIRLLDGTVGEITEFGFVFRYLEEKLVKVGQELRPEQTEQNEFMPFEHDYGDVELRLADGGNFWTCGGLLYAWKQERDARLFCDARNRLAYAAAVGPVSDAIPDFDDAVRVFRSGKAPAPPAEVERRRVLAENAFQEKDYFGALEHYEAGLQVYRTWPEGWFNAALLYEGLGEWESAISRMNRYLALMPDAPDAKAAQEKLIIWTEKAKR